MNKIHSQRLMKVMIMICSQHVTDPDELISKENDDVWKLI